MALILPGNVASATASTAYNVDNSCRFNDGDAATLEKALGTPTSQQKFTYSCWFKRGVLSGDQSLFSCGSSGDDEWNDFRLGSGGEIQWYIDRDEGYYLTTDRLFRDVAAWYHFVIAVDTTQATNTNRIKLYVNGVQEATAALNVNAYPAEDYALTAMASGENVSIGKRAKGGALNLDGFLAECCFIDGLALAPTSFGEFDEDSPTIWKPIEDVKDLTFGNNGFYLDFKDSANLGNDANGGTDLTEANLAAADQATDTPTNNFCTLNPLDNYYAASTFSEGNLKVSTNAANKTFNTSTFAVTKGKWYWEVKITTTASESAEVGIASVPSPQAGAGGGELNDSAGNYEYRSDGTKGNANSNSSYGDTWNTDNDIVGVALDMDNLKLYFAKNGTWQASGDPTSGATGTNAAFTITAPASQTLAGSLNAYTPALGEEGAQTDVFELNFGNPIVAPSSGNADGNGYGNFEYAPPSGYFSLCTKNLAEYG